MYVFKKRKVRFYLKNKKNKIVYQNALAALKNMIDGIQHIFNPSNNHESSCICEENYNYRKSLISKTQFLIKNYLCRANILFFDKSVESII